MNIYQKDTLKRYFRAKHDLAVTLLSDQDRHVMRQYGVWRQTRWQGEVVGRIARTTFLIDPTGRIAWAWRHVVPGGHAEEVGRKLKGMRATHTAE